MLSATEVDALVSARHSDPFAALGLHADAKGALWLRAMLPGAAGVAVLDAGTGKSVAALALRDPGGLWEGAIPRRKKRFDYRLQVQWAAGGQGTYADAYAYGALIPDADLHFFGEGAHLRPFTMLGAHPMSIGGANTVHGVRFAVWAPNAKRVSVIGDFNAWDGRRHAMRSRGGGGVWEIFIPHVAVGDRYKFELLAADGNLLPAKADPYAFAAEMRPATASIVAPLPPTRALPADRAAANARHAPVSIYELHVGSWRRHPDGSMHSWDELAAALPAYVADLGFTHVELLPVSEHPFDGSWGYQTLGLYAPSARFGPPEGFARFVAACRAHGLGLLIDWVPAHFPSDAFGLARFDGTALYEYADPREGFHHDWNTLIYNFGRHEVKNFLVGNALYWIERFGVDGLRVDAVASMLYRDYSRQEGQWIANARGGRENLEAIAFLQRTNEVIGAECAGAITLAEESTAYAGVSAPTYSGGLGFHYKWNMGWMHDTLEYMSEDPVHRRWHHDKMSFGLVYAFSENFVLPLSHDEVVHGKGSILGRMPGDDWQRFANLRAYYGFMWGHPGKKLLFMGQEFAQGSEWNHDGELPWALLQDERHAGVQRLVRDLNRLYRERPALHRLDSDAAGFEWIDAHDAERSIYSWVRRDGQGEVILVVSNMTPVPRDSMTLGVPAGPSAWREVLNTDSRHYGGSNHGNGAAVLPVRGVASHARAQSIELTVPPLATVFLVPA
ncbi:MAG: 1,4-alpha-glucan branching protein GlgB [Pseudomonadota bacterium]